MQAKRSQWTDLYVWIPAITIMAVATASAEAMHYVETVDFSNSQNSPSLLSPPLDIGDNTISGRAVSLLGLEQDNDFFKVQLPTGLLLTEVTITISNYGPDGSELGSFSLLPTTQGTLDIVSNGTFRLPLALDNPQNIVFLTKSPVDLGTFSFGSFDYVVHLKVESDRPVLRLDSLGNLSWNAESGTVYQVQWAPVLATNSWSDLGGAVTALTTTVTLMDDISSVQTRFYRLSPVNAP